MKNASTILSAIALLGVIVLFGLHFSNGNKSNMPGNISSTSSDKEISSSSLRLAYIDIDTFEANYVMLKNKKEEFTKRKNAMEAELQRSGQQLQNDATAFQKKVQAQAFSPAEGEAAQRRLMQMQESLETRKATMEEQFTKDQIAFNETLHKELDSFLEEYNATKHYAYIFSYSKSNPQIMYADKSLNITHEVIKGMNERTPAATAKAK